MPILPIVTELVIGVRDSTGLQGPITPLEACMFSTAKLEAIQKIMNYSEAEVLDALRSNALNPPRQQRGPMVGTAPGRLPVGVADAPNYPPMTSPGAREAIRAGGYRIGDPGPVTMLGGGSEVGQTIGTRGDTLMRNHALGAQVARGLEEAQAEMNLRRSAEYEAEKARQQAIVDAQTAPHPGTGLATTIGNPEDFVGLNSMGDPVDSAGNVLPGGDYPRH